MQSSVTGHQLTVFGKKVVCHKNVSKLHTILYVSLRPSLPLSLSLSLPLSLLPRRFRWLSVIMDGVDGRGHDIRLACPVTTTLIVSLTRSLLLYFSLTLSGVSTLNLHGAIQITGKSAINVAFLVLIGYLVSTF